MTTNRNTKINRTNRIRCLIAAAILSAAPLTIAIDTATPAHADTTVSTPNPSFHSPAQHPAFPHQSTVPSPGTPAHHHHQHHKCR